MDIIHMQSLVYAEPFPATTQESVARQDKILADLNAPVYLGRPTKLNYDNKTDRYAAVFNPSESTLTLKTTNEVAAFLAEHISKAGYWQGRMEDGALVDVYLIQQL